MSNASAARADVVTQLGLLPEPKVGGVTLFQGDNLPILRGMPDESVHLIYVDPPFNTGKKQTRTQLKTTRDDEGDRTGFQGNRYKTVKLGSRSFGDSFSDFLAFLEPRLEEAHRLLTKNGSFFLHLDYREVHYAKVLCDAIFGRESFINEIIWAYDYGARSKSRWPAKHDNILFYAKDPNDFCFDREAMDRIPYMAPGLVGEEKAALGKTPTDTWWHTIVSPNGKEKNRLSDAEAARHHRSDREGALASWRRASRLFCRQRDTRRIGRKARTRCDSDRRKSGSDRSDEEATRAISGDGVS